MIRGILAFFVLLPLSRIAGLVGKIGSALPIHRSYTWVFNRLIGINEAREWRDDHVEKVSEIIVDSNVEVEDSPEQLTNEIEASRKRVESFFSDGESVLSLAIAVASFIAPPLVATVLAIVLVISVSVRQTAIRTLAYDDQDPGQSVELLRSKHMWNTKILKSKNVTGSLLSLGLMKDIDEELYNRYLNEVFVPTVHDFSKTEALNRFWAIAKEELWTSKSN